MEIIFNKNEEIALDKGYWISEEGLLYNAKAEEIKGYNDSKGYKQFGIRLSKKKVIKIKFHRLQAYQKFGDKIYEKTMVVRHLNGNPLDNSKSNIEIGNMSQNMMDRDPEARRKHSENSNKKYSDETVAEILKLHSEGMGYKKLMEKFNISSKGTISHIINKRLCNSNN